MSMTLHTHTYVEINVNIPLEIDLIKQKFKAWDNLSLKRDNVGLKRFPADLVPETSCKSPEKIFT